MGEEKRGKREEKRAESREKRAESREQRAETREQRAESREHREERREVVHMHIHMLWLLFLRAEPTLTSVTGLCACSALAIEREATSNARAKA